MIGTSNVIMEITSIYLSGSVAKSDAESASTVDWRDAFRNILSKDKEYHFHHPGEVRIHESDQYGVFGLNAWMVKNADLTIVYGENKIGIGTAQEALMAKYFGKPVIFYCPKNSYNRRDIIHDGKEVADWIHPFVQATADAIIETIEELPQSITELRDIKDISIIDDAIIYVEENYPEVTKKCEKKT